MTRNATTTNGTSHSPANRLAELLGPPAGEPATKKKPGAKRPAPKRQTRKAAHDAATKALVLWWSEAAAVLESLYLAVRAVRQAAGTNPRVARLFEHASLGDLEREFGDATATFGCWGPRLAGESPAHFEKIIRRLAG